MCEAGRPVLASPLSEAANYTAGAGLPLFENTSHGVLLRASAYLIRHAEASVDEQDVAGHIVRGARRKKDRGTGDFGRLAPASRGRAPGNPGGKFRVRKQRRVHLGPEKPRRDAVDLHVVRRKLDRERAGE